MAPLSTQTPKKTGESACARKVVCAVKLPDPKRGWETVWLIFVSFHHPCVRDEHGRLGTVRERRWWFPSPAMLLVSASRGVWVFSVLCCSRCIDTLRLHSCRLFCSHCKCFQPRLWDKGLSYELKLFGVTEGNTLKVVVATKWSNNLSFYRGLMFSHVILKLHRNLAGIFGQNS